MFLKINFRVKKIKKSPIKRKIPISLPQAGGNKGGRSLTGARRVFHGGSADYPRMLRRSETLGQQKIKILAFSDGIFRTVFHIRHIFNDI